MYLCIINKEYFISDEFMDNVFLFIYLFHYMQEKYKKRKKEDSTHLCKIKDKKEGKTVLYSDITVIVWTLQT